MNETTEDELNQKRNMLYYNQLILNEKRAEYLHRKKEKDTKKQKSFILQKIKSENHLLSEKLKVVIYVFFLIGIPYIVGACFLFLFVANANWDNFQLLDLNEFFTLWLIGSETIVICLLVWFAFLYIRNNRKYKNKF